MTAGIMLKQFNMDNKVESKQYKQFKTLCKHEGITFNEITDNLNRCEVYVNQLDEVNAESILQDLN